jgi:hypothetical protein
LHQDKGKVEGNPRESYSSETESDDFSLWSDTRDITEQLTNEDPLRIELHPLSSEGRRLDGHSHGGGRKKVSFLHKNRLDRKVTQPGIEKAAIPIPDPPPRHISKAEKLLALIMTPNNLQAAKSRGLVGKKLL